MNKYCFKDYKKNQVNNRRQWLYPKHTLHKITAVISSVATSSRNSMQEKQQTSANGIIILSKPPRLASSCTLPEIIEWWTLLYWEVINPPQPPPPTSPNQVSLTPKWKTLDLEAQSRPLRFQQTYWLHQDEYKLNQNFRICTHKHSKNFLK